MPEHTFEQGYIGVSSRGAEARFKEHLSVASNGSTTTLSKAIRKYGDKLIVRTLLKGSEDYCYLMEERLRPHDRIGWNIVRGGGKPPVFRGHSEESKAKIGLGAKKTSQSAAHKAANEARRGVPRTEESKVKMREAAKGRLPWETSLAKKELWAVADEFYTYFVEENCGHIKLEKHFNFPAYALKAMHSKFKKQNWIPTEDPVWSEWSTEYKLTNF